MKRQNSTAVAGFFSRESGRLVNFVRSLIDDATDRDAEDIVQDVAFHILEKGDILEPIEHMAGYVFQALRNRVIDLFRSRRDQISLDEPLGDGSDLCLADCIADGRSDLRSLLEDRDLFERAIACIRELPERDRAVIIATEIEGFSFAELSERWGVPVGTLLSQKSRALRKIREALSSGPEIKTVHL
jgi:RNA polymerase sigma factor (sigma-70 family)